MPQTSAPAPLTVNVPPLWLAVPTMPVAPMSRFAHPAGKAAAGGGGVVAVVAAAGVAAAACGGSGSVQCEIVVVEARAVEAIAFSVSVQRVTLDFKYWDANVL